MAAMEPARPSHVLKVVLLAVVLAALALSSLSPFDWPTWWMEVSPVLVAVPLLTFTHRRLEFTPLLYVMMAAFCVLMVTGGHYTYARVPFGEWLRETLGTVRNPYDRLGHAMQGVVPALIARELLVRTSPLKPGGWLFTCCTALALSVAALYELLEYAAALVAGDGSIEFLGVQGDIWDAQNDMFTAWVSAMLALLLLGRWHDRQLARLAARHAAGTARLAPGAGTSASAGA